MSSLGASYDFMRRGWIDEVLVFTMGGFAEEALFYVGICKGPD